MQLEFTKMHGLGNDFIMIEDLAGELEFSAEAVRWFCDRHFGIGADGIILIRKPTTAQADLYMHYMNSDGSLAEMCGNGIRCFAKYAADHGLVPADRDNLVVETLGGLRPITISRENDGSVGVATVDMGAPVFAPEEIPTTLAPPTPDEPIVRVPLHTEIGTWEVTCVSIGNPHCVLWVEDVDAAPVELVGPVIERHPAFPARTNVEFAQLGADGSLRVRVWERGCGETLACGTGAAATVVAATLAGKVDHSAVIDLAGGELDTVWDEESGHVFITGAATEIFSGSLDLPEETE
jgi:diaminopimelate epimerase